MADITFTPAAVVKGSGASVAEGVAGATITPGRPIYKDTDDSNKYKACDADAAATASCDGIALNSADDGQPIDFITLGDLTFGTGVFIAGEVYTVSGNPGGVGPHSDRGAGEYVTVLGVATSTTTIAVKIINSATVIA